MSRMPLRIAYVVVTVAALAAAVLSFNALMDLAAHNGTPAHLAFLFPVVVDLTGVAATVSLLAMKSSGVDEGRWFPWMVLGISVAISLAANGIHAAPFGVIGVALAMVPPLMLLLSTELCVRLIDAGRVNDTAVDAAPLAPVVGLEPLMPSFRDDRIAS